MKRARKIHKNFIFLSAACLVLRTAGGFALLAFPPLAPAAQGKAKVWCWGCLWHFRELSPAAAGGSLPACRDLYASLGGGGVAGGKFYVF